MSRERFHVVWIEDEFWTPKFEVFFSLDTLFNYLWGIDLSQIAIFRNGKLIELQGFREINKLKDHIENFILNQKENDNDSNEQGN